MGKIMYFEVKKTGDEKYADRQSPEVSPGIIQAMLIILIA